MRRALLVGLLCSILPIGTLAAQPPGKEDSASAAEAVEEIAAEEPELRGIMILRVSERYLEELFARDIDKHGPVYRVVLGTRARGTAHTQGRADVDTKPDHDDAAFYVRINGTTRARTVGHNGPAIIHSRSNSTWTAQKTIRFDGERFVTTPATVHSHTRITPLGADSVLPGLRGRIVSRIATRRARESNSTAERITQRDTEKQVLADVDRVVEGQIEKLNERIDGPILATLLPKLKDAGVEFSTSSNCININFGGSASPEAKIVPVEGLEPSDTELWFQTALIAGEAAKVPEMIDNAGEWLSEQLPDIGISGVDMTGLSVLPVNVELVGDWLVLKSLDLPTPDERVTAKPLITD